MPIVNCPVVFVDMLPASIWQECKNALADEPQVDPTLDDNFVAQHNGVFAASSFVEAGDEHKPKSVQEAKEIIRQFAKEKRKSSDRVTRVNFTDRTTVFERRKSIINALLEWGDYVSPGDLTKLMGLEHNSSNVSMVSISLSVLSDLEIIDSKIVSGPKAKFRHKKEYQADPDNVKLRNFLSL